MTSKVEKELQKALGVKPKPKEDEQKYFQRILDKADGMEDDEFQELSDEAQEWLNIGNKKADKNKEIPGFEEPEEDEDEDEDKSDEDEDSDSKDEDDGDEDEDEDEDDKKSKKSSKKSKKSKDEDEDEDEDSSGGDEDEDEDGDEDVADKKKSGKDKGSEKSKGKDKDTKDKKKSKSKDDDDDDSKGNGGTRSAARKKVFSYLLKHPDASVADVAEEVDQSPSAVSLAVKYWKQITEFLKEKGKL